jgi:glycosyltransferase involved in cell wall biosynthesis
MRIAIVSYGFGEYCIEQANGLARDANVLLVLPEDEAAEYLARLDPRVEFRPFAKPRLRQPVRQLASVYRLVQQIRRFQPDLIHLQNGHLWFNMALPLLRSYPMVVTVHDPRHHIGDRSSRKTPQSVMDFGFRRADRLIVHGQSLKRQVADEIGIPDGRIDVIPHIAIGRPQSAPPVAEESNTVLFFGRIWDYKGLEYLIEAEPLVAREVPDVRFVIAGEGDDFGRYRRMMVHPERFAVHNHYVPAAMTSELFGSASVVVLPYVEATQSGVIPVAYAFSKPVVATETGALSEMVDDGTTGLLVPPRDTNALAAAVIKLLKDPVLRRTMGAAGRRKLDAECAPEVVARQTLDVYRRAIKDYGLPLPLREGRGEGELLKHKTPSPCPLPRGEGSETSCSLPGGDGSETNTKRQLAGTRPCD